MRNFVALFVAINPISVLSLFVALTAECAPTLRRQLAIKSVLVAFAVMLFFIVVAEFIIEAIGLSLRSFQIAGGIILFLVAISLVLGTGEIGRVQAPADSGMAIFPLAVPAICGPGTMLTAMVLADDNRFGVLEQAQTILAGALVLVITLALLLFAGPVYRFLIGPGIANVIRRIMGMLLAAFAVKLALSGIAGWLGLADF